MSDHWNGEPWDDPKPPVGTVGGHKDFPIVRIEKTCRQCEKVYVGWTFDKKSPVKLVTMCDDCVDSWRKHPDTIAEIEREAERKAIIAQEYSRPLRTGTG